MTNGLLLWIDDEIELLKAHIIFLEKKGYKVETVSNGADAIEKCISQTFDLVLIDEQMPGLSGIETLQRIKEVQPATPIVMVTKSDEEDIMNQAIGSKIADYLIKPVNPSQILLTLKKNIHEKEILTEVTQTNYQQEYRNIDLQIDSCKNFKDWSDIYKRLVKWELNLSNADSSMTDMLINQKKEANINFAKYISKNYLNWIYELSSNKRLHIDSERPLMSPELIKSKVFPLIDKKEKVFLIVIDNLRLDQWRLINQEIGELFEVEEDTYLTILPTATQYARNAIFSGLMPLQIAKMFPNLWIEEDDEKGKNLYEEDLLKTQIERYRRHDKITYNKVNDTKGAEKFIQQLNSLEQNDLNVLVINFIDMLSHARTEMKMIRELASDESAYRSLTISWFKHSFFSEVLRKLSHSNYKIIITTDHGSIRTTRPVKIIGDRNTNTNLRYKLGKNLNYNSKSLFVIKEPAKAQLPAPNISTSYVFATENDFFAYPNNYNYYVAYYKDTFQHGGISMEEMIVPLITLTPKKRI